MRGNALRMMSIVALIPLLLSGCLFGPETPEIDPPPDTTSVDSEEAGIEQAEEPLQEADKSEADTEEDEAAASETQEVELYVKDSAGYVVPYSVAIPKTEGIAQKQLAYMVKVGRLKKRAHCQKDLHLYCQKERKFSASTFKMERQRLIYLRSF